MVSGEEPGRGRQNAPWAQEALGLSVRWLESPSEPVSPLRGV